MHSTSLSPGTSRYPQSSSHPFQTNKQLLTKYVIGCVMKVSYFCTTCWWINHESLSSGTKHTKYVVTWHGMIQSCLWSSTSLFTNDLLLFTFLFTILRPRRGTFSPRLTWPFNAVQLTKCPISFHMWGPFHVLVKSNILHPCGSSVNLSQTVLIQVC